MRWNLVARNFPSTSAFITSLDPYSLNLQLRSYLKARLHKYTCSVGLSLASLQTNALIHTFVSVS
jgi:hypothetical protein